MKSTLSVCVQFSHPPISVVREQSSGQRRKRGKKDTRNTSQIGSEQERVAQVVRRAEMIRKNRQEPTSALPGCQKQGQKGTSEKCAVALSQRARGAAALKSHRSGIDRAFPRVFRISGEKSANDRTVFERSSQNSRRKASFKSSLTTHCPVDRISSALLFIVSSLKTSSLFSLGDFSLAFPLPKGLLVFRLFYIKFFCLFSDLSLVFPLISLCPLSSDLSFASP